MPAAAPALLPYREDGIVKYVPASTATPHVSSYDSDAEPLISSPSDLDPEDLQRFTATGRPMPTFKQSPLANLDMYSVPQLLPVRYTDDSIIPAIIVDVIPKVINMEENSGKKRFFFKFKPVLKDKITKVIYMPRRDYQKWFARGLGGEYIGTEPYRQWTEEELEEQFGKYRPVVEKKSMRLRTGGIF